MGLSEEEMCIWTPNEEPGWDALEAAKIVLWHGYCSVHRRFTIEQITEMRMENENALIVVHPECRDEIVAAADAVGSTEFIRNYVADQPEGSVIGVGTEINMVKRLDAKYPNKSVTCLDPLVCPCSTMYMIHPMYLLDVLERIIAGEIPNQVKVPAETSAKAKLSLDRMLSIRN
nr:quinolinate synthase NadA [Euryarchaeota archaeon]